MSIELKKSKSGWIAALLLAMLALVVALPATNVFAAGNISFRDDASLFTSADRSALQEQVRGLPYDVLIVTSSNYTSAQRTQFRNAVVGVTGGTKFLTIGISNNTSSGGLRTVVVDPGSELGITGSESSNIEAAAGNVLNSSPGQWRNAMIASLNEAKRVSSLSTGGGGGWIGWVIFGAIVVVILLLVTASRRRSGGRATQPAYTTPNPVYMNQPGYGQQGYGQPGYPPPGYGQPGYYNNNQGGSGLGGALMGGVAGFVLGEALGGHNRNDGGYNQQQPGFFPGGGNNDANDAGSGTDFGSFGGGSGGSSGGDFGGGGGGSGDFGGGGDSGGGGGGDSSW